MTENELDELLDRWKAPPMRDSVRENLRAQFAAAKRPNPPAPKLRIGKFALVTAAAAAVLFAIVQVAPRTAGMASPGFRIPYYVEYDFERFSDDGRPPHRTRITSFPYAGHEINVSVMESGDSLLNVIRNIGSSIRTQVVLAIPSLVLPKEPPMAEPAWFAGFVKSGCSEGKNVVGHETVAGHETTVIETSPPGRRLKVWMAPDLDCAALKMTFEVQEPNGAYRLELRREAVKVTMSR